MIGKDICMNNVIKFPTISVVEDNPTDEMNEFIEDNIDDFIEKFIVFSIENFPTTDENILIREDEKSTKMLCFLKETLMATVCMLQSKEHIIQEIATDVIYFGDESENEKENEE